MVVVPWSRQTVSLFPLPLPANKGGPKKHEKLDCQSGCTRADLPRPVERTQRSFEWRLYAALIHGNWPTFSVRDTTVPLCPRPCLQYTDRRVASRHTKVVVFIKEKIKWAGAWFCFSLFVCFCFLVRRSISVKVFAGYIYNNAIGTYNILNSFIKYKSIVNIIHI